MAIRTLIVDDEPLARRRIRQFLASESDIEVVAECGSGREAVEALEDDGADLVFLDIAMPEMDGFEVLAAVERERLPAVVFVTAYDEYAVRAFEVHAVDYLLKPLERRRFQEALREIREQIGREREQAVNQDLLALLEEMKGRRRYLARLAVKKSGRVHFVKADDIDWIDAAGNYVRLNVGGETHLMRETMTNLESKLDPEKFLRIHRSTIVNIERIQEIQPLYHGEYLAILHSGKRLTLSRGYRDQLGRFVS